MGRSALDTVSWTMSCWHETRRSRLTLQVQAGRVREAVQLQLGDYSLLAGASVYRGHYAPRILISKGARSRWMRYQVSEVVKARSREQMRKRD
jgi:hypothetical protein